MKRKMQIAFYLSVIGLTISCLLPLSGVDWDREAIPLGIMPFALAVIVTWIISSGLRPKDDPSGKRFGRPRIAWGWVGLWGFIVGLIISVSSSIEADSAKYSVERERRNNEYSSFSYASSRLEDARIGIVVGGVITVIGAVSSMVAGGQAIRRRRKVRLEI